MMEDPNMEWQIKNYSCSVNGDEEESSDKTSSSKLSWILNTTLSLGKKFVVTGFVVSSLPLVLPPLVVVSALGFAVSLPFGFVYASYAGAEKLMSKLMSKLLPSPTPPHYMIDYEGGEEEEEEAMIGSETEERDKKQDIIEDENEIIIEFLGEDDGVNEQEKLGNEDRFMDDIDEESNVGEIVGERTNEAKEQEKLGGEEQVKDDDVSKVEKELNASETQEDKTKELDKRESESVEESVVLDVKVTEPVLLQVETVTVVENEGGYNASTEEQNAGLDVKVTRPVSEVHTVKFVEDEGKRSVEIPRNSEDKNGEVEKNVPADKGIIERSEENLPAVKSMTEKDKKRQANSKGKGSSTESDKRAKIKSSTTVQKSSGKKKADKRRGPELAVQERTTDSPSEGILIGRDNVESTRISASKKDDEQSVLSSGKKDVGDSDIPIVQSEKPADNKNEVVHKSKTTQDENEHSMEAAALTGLPELKNHGVMPQLKGQNDADHDLHSEKERRDRDEQIWKEIDAIRVIVGFQAPRHTLYSEELKALYLFTGIEPPSSAESSSDTAEEFYSNLQFLKSVIGVK